MPAVPMPRPSSSSEARYSTDLRRSISKAGAPLAVGTAGSSVSAATESIAAELQARGTASKLQQRTRRPRVELRIGRDCMSPPPVEQPTPGRLNSPIRIGVVVGGTFPDLVAFDGERLHVIKLPSTP